MTQIEPPSLERSRRKPLLSDDPDKRSVQIALLATVLIHVVLLLLFWKVIKPDPNAQKFYRTPLNPQQSFSIELAPPDPEEELRPPQQFVEANPNSNDKIPDKTNNFAAQNQTAAQEKPTPDSDSERPALEGQTEIKTNQIVSGQLNQPTIAIPPAPPSEPQEQKEIDTPRREQNPLAGTQRDSGESLTGFGTQMAPTADNMTPTVTQPIEGSRNSTSLTGAVTTRPVVDPQRPRPRPSIVKTQSTRPAIFTENKVGTSNIGLIGVSAQFSNYGAYLQRMIEAIQIKWDSILNESKIYPPRGTMAVLRFRMDKEGAVTEILEVSGDTTDQGKQSCASAITAPSPFGKWTDDMVALLGENQELTFQFYYQ